jgi:serine/threonine protein kinase/tetratricopeptide (TPR) repeat protein
MTTWNPRANELFLQALELASPAERQQYLDGACGSDPALRAEVESLLEASARAGSFLASPAAAAHLVATVDELPVVERPGTVIGPYKLLEQIGEGGFGIVFMAEQTQPVRRKVALKVLKPGMDTAQVTARFEAERQALALMDHPNIAQVFDGGETAGGRPYFVMELVRGVPITRFCDEEHLAVRDRLELFINVCAAVQHAHLKGIIHRDLKPSNVLVTLHDGTPVVKVIDFGVAKALGQSLTDRTLFTGFAQMIGTPLYMSPEQAGMSGLDVDTRSDVYALGVLLYELLTGTTPFDQERLKQVDYDEMRRIIREEEPPKPSTRISTLGQAATTLSTQRKSDPKRLRQLFRGELDWIVMKAMEKDRNRRYESASAFAADVHRYLKDEPVLACPPSAWYRLRKFARRKKATLATATVLALAALLGGAGLLWLQGQSIALSRDVVGHLEEAEQWERKGNWSLTLQAVERAEGRLAGGGPGSLRRRAEQVRKRVQLVADLEESRLNYSAMVREGGYDATEAARAYAQAFKNHGWDVEALAAEEMAGQIAASPIRVQLVAALDHWAIIKPKRDVLGCKNLLSVARLADDDDWRRQLRDPAVRKDRAALERLAQSEGVLSQPAGSLVLLASALVEVKARSAAVDLLRRAQQRHPDDFWINHELAFHLTDLNPARVEEGIGFFRAAVALRPQSPGAHLNLGVALYDQGKLAEAEKAYRKAIELKADYASAYLNLGNIRWDQKRLAEAEAAFRKALDLRPDYALAYNHLGNALTVQGKLPEAVAALHRAIHLQPDLARAYNNLGNALCAQRKPAEAEKAFRNAIKRKPDYHMAYNNLGNALRDQGKTADAVAAYREAIKLKPESAAAYYNLGTALRDQRKLAEAEAAFRKAIALQPDNARAYHSLGSALLVQKKPAEAEQAFTKAIDLGMDNALAHYNLGIAFLNQRREPEAEAAFRKAVKRKPDFPEAHCNLGVALRQQGRFAAALASFKRGHELGSRVPGWHSALCEQWARQAEKLLALDRKLPRLLKREVQPAGVEEQLVLAQLCQQPFKRLYAAAARFYSDAFTADPSLLEGLRSPHRYKAASIAALAGTGRGADADKLDEKERTRWRKQALAWLRAELDLWRDQVESQGGAVRDRTQEVLQLWQRDPHLAGVRDVPALQRLPREERLAWRDLWWDVAVLLARVKPEARGAPPDKP